MSNDKKIKNLMSVAARLLQNGTDWRIILRNLSIRFTMNAKLASGYFCCLFAFGEVRFRMHYQT